VTQGRHVPVAAARIQLTPELGFDEAAGTVPYLSRLGFSHLYTSPVAEAVLGSRHGYDVTDPQRVRDELGGPDGLARLLDTLSAHGMGWLLDIVPNHMAVVPAEQNPWWWDVLRHGRASRHAETFDIDWEAGAGTVVLPSGPVDVGSARVVGDVIEIAGLRLPLAPGSQLSTDGDEDLDALLAGQHWSLSGHRGRLRNYRCFFAISELGGVRVERPDVFERVHALVRTYRHHPAFAGVRVDHVDGLADPDGYLVAVRDLVGPDAWLVVEKILIGSEVLPERWPLDGSTGYDFCRDVTSLLTDGRGMATLDELWRAVSGDGRPYEELEWDAELEVAARMLAPDLARLRRLLVRADPRLADADTDGALAALGAALPVYRTYLPAGGDADIALLRAAAVVAAATRPELADALDRVVELTISGDHPEITTRLQQLGAPITAKGAEDTAFYRYFRLVALNDVGGDPGGTGCELDTFHRRRLADHKRHPRTLLTTSTHDTKRSEDVRARLLVLAQRPEEWRDAVGRWHLQSEPHRGVHGPSPALEYLGWQTVVGAWPIGPGRLLAALTKSAREAALETSWISPDLAYEADLAAWVHGVVDDEALVGQISSFVAAIDGPGQALSLAQALLRLTCPGVGDLYQGCDLWDRSLVDPDNRRPVDWSTRPALWDQVAGTDLASCYPETGGSGLGGSGLGGSGPGQSDPGGPGLSKLVVIGRTLAHRAARAEDFGPGAEGAYRPLAVAGTEGDPLVAFARGRGTVVAARRFPAATDVDEAATITLPPGRWRHVLVDGQSPIGDTVAVADVMRGLPVALLTVV